MTPGIADVRVGQDEGRPELAIRVDRPKGRDARPDGATASPQTIQTNVAGTTAGAVPASAATSIRSSSGCARTIARQVTDVGDVLLNTPSGQVVPAQNVLAVDRETGPVQIDRKNMERIVRVQRARPKCRSATR